MATQVITSRHLSGIPEPEDVSTGSADVEMLLVSPTAEEEVVEEGEEGEEKTSSSDEGHRNDESPVPEPLTPVTPASEGTTNTTLVTVGVPADSTTNKPAANPNVHHHHHYHYFYHHHFHHLNGQQNGSSGEAKATEITSTSASSTLPTLLPAVRPQLMIAARPSSAEDLGTSKGLSGASSPTTPLTPFSPSTPPTGAPVWTPLSEIATQNTAALVRTISNGSTFGPINAPPENWPSFGTPSSQHPLAQEAGSSMMTTTSQSELLNRVNNSNVSQTSAGPGTSSASSAGAISPLLPSPNPTVPPVLKSILKNPITATASSTLPAITFQAPAVTPPRPRMYSPVPRSHVATSTHNGNSKGHPKMTTMVTVQPFPVQPTLLYPQDLPLVFGDKFILVSQMEASNLYRCFDKETKAEFCCKVLLSKSYNDFLAPHFRMDGHEGINQVQKIIVGKQYTFILFEQAYGDLHSYVRSKRRIREVEAAGLFKQVVQIVADCHQNGIILRDLKLRKFIFSNKQKTQLKLECLEGAALCEEGDDTLNDKHGCPAYVSPEILNCDTYSGMIADCWSLGVILYTMLTGRYPFHDASPAVVFCKIRRGTFFMPEFLTKNAKCLIRSLIRLDPEQRLTSGDTLSHRWFKTAKTAGSGIAAKRSPSSAHQSLSSAAAAAAAAISHHHHHHHHHHHQTASQSLGGHHSLPGTPLLTTITNPGGAAIVIPTGPTSSIGTPGTASLVNPNSPSAGYRDDGMDLMPTRVMTRGPVIGPRIGPNHPVGGQQTQSPLRQLNNVLLSTFAASLIHPLSNTTFPLRNPPVHNHDPFTTCTFQCFHAPTAQSDQIVPDLIKDDEEESLMLTE